MEFLYLPQTRLSRRTMVSASALICVATASMLIGCKTIETASLHVKTSRMLAELDSTQSGTKSIALVEIDKTGEAKLYQRTRFQNTWDEPIESLPGVAGFAAIPLYTVGGEQATVELGSYLPNQIERHYTAKFRHPVPPGAWVDMMMVGEQMTKYRTRPVEDGLWRFGPVTAHMNGSEMAYLLAVKVPPSARIVNFQPKPDEIRYDDAHILIWERTPSDGKDLELVVEYRLGDAGSRSRPTHSHPLTADSVGVTEGSSKSPEEWPEKSKSAHSIAATRKEQKLRLAPNVFDVWVFHRTESGVEYLLLHTSQIKADRYFNGGRFWQIPSGFVEDDEDLVTAIDRRLAVFGLRATLLWAAEHAYVIYNRRFGQIQIISVYAAEVPNGDVRLDPEEHSEFAWLPFEECLTRIHFRGLKDGLRSTKEYVTGVRAPAKELQLR